MYTDLTYGCKGPCNTTYQPSSLLGRVTYTLLLDGERSILIGQTVDVAEIRGVGGVICFPKGSRAMQDGARHGWAEMLPLVMGQTSD